MTFRVITGNTYQGNSKVEVADKPKDLAIRPADTAPRPQLPAPAQELAPVGQLLDRLEALSFTFEALNASSRTYAAEAVLETLARMERRDLQALAAIEAFASALKTVSQHLAGLRNAVHATAHESALGLEHIGERLARLEQKAGFAAGAEAGAMLDGIAQRLAGIEAIVAGHEPEIHQFDAGPITEMLDTIARRVSRIEKKVGEIPTGQGGDKFDAVPLTTLMETIARRLSRLETKVQQSPPGQAVDTSAINAALETIARRVSRIENKLAEAPAPAAPAPAVDTAPINAALETIARRVSRIEKKMDEPVAAAAIELDATPLNDALETIAQQVGALERKMESGVDGHSVAACLLALDRRLSRMESGLTKDGEVSQISAPPAPIVAPVAQLRSEPEPLPEPAVEPLSEPQQVTTATVEATLAESAPPAPAAPAVAEEAVGARQRVDLLLEQVFRVLSR